MRTYSPYFVSGKPLECRELCCVTVFIKAQRLFLPLQTPTPTTGSLSSLALDSSTSADKQNPGAASASYWAMDGTIRMIDSPVGARLVVHLNVRALRTSDDVARGVGVGVALSGRSPLARMLLWLVHIASWGRGIEDLFGERRKSSKVRMNGGISCWPSACVPPPAVCRYNCLVRIVESPLRGWDDLAAKSNGQRTLL